MYIPISSSLLGVIQSCRTYTACDGLVAFLGGSCWHNFGSTVCMYYLVLHWYQVTTETVPGPGTRYLLLVATFYAFALHFNRWPGIGIRHWSTGTWNEVTSKLLLSFCRNSYNLASGYPDTGQLVPGEPWYSEHLVLYCTYTPLTQRYGCHSFFLIDFFVST